MPPVEVHRVVLLGASRVGKTALVSRFMHNRMPGRYRETIDDLHSFVFSPSDTKSFHMEILDTAGSDEFPVMRQLSIRSSQAFIIVYAFNDSNSFRTALELVKLVFELKGDCANIPIWLCGNKSDIYDDNCKIEKEKQMGKASKTKSVVSLEVSAKDDHNVDALFEMVFQALTTPSKESVQKS